jgi:hypothetical protein
LPYSEAHDPLDLRHRAEEARAMAEGANDPGAKKTFIGIAETYDKLAQYAEDRCAPVQQKR